MPEETNSAAFNKAQSDIKKYRGLSLINLIGAVLVVFGFVVWGAGFGYMYVLANQSETLKEEIQQFREPLELENQERKQSIEQVIQVDRAIDRGAALLAGRKAIGGVFDVIERYTLVDVRYEEFSYSRQENAVVLRARAFDDRAFAEQLAVFRAAPEFSNISFDQIELASDGSISFLITLGVKNF